GAEFRAALSRRSRDRPIRGPPALGVRSVRPRVDRPALGRPGTALLRADVVSGGGPMTRGAGSEFPELERVFSGYLHEDFAAEYGSPEAALRAFHDDASPAEWRRFQREAKRLAALAESRDFEEVCTLLQQLGSRWVPPSRDVLIALLTSPANPTRSGSR